MCLSRSSRTVITSAAKRPRTARAPRTRRYPRLLRCARDDRVGRLQPINRRPHWPPILCVRLVAFDHTIVADAWPIQEKSIPALARRHQYAAAADLEDIDTPYVDW